MSLLQFKYKRRVYKLMQINPRKLKQLHTKVITESVIDDHVAATVCDLRADAPTLTGCYNAVCTRNSMTGWLLVYGRLVVL